MSIHTMAQDLQIYRRNVARDMPKPASLKTIIDALQTTVYDLIGPQQNNQQLRWNVVRSIFYAIYERLGELYKKVAGYIGLVVERDRALGAPVDGCPPAVTANSKLSEMLYKKMRDADGIEMQSAAFKTKSNRVYARIEATKKDDPVTASMLQKVAHDIDKQLCMLRAHQQ